ncbi:hypothetical protein QJQ45_021001, partial [Haematococcus lacustris]
CNTAPLRITCSMAACQQAAVKQFQSDPRRALKRYGSDQRVMAVVRRLASTSMQSQQGMEDLLLQLGTDSDTLANTVFSDGEVAAALTKPRVRAALAEIRADPEVEGHGQVCQRQGGLKGTGSAASPATGGSRLRCTHSYSRCVKRFNPSGRIALAAKIEQAAEPTKGKGKGKAAKVKPSPQPGRLDRNCNAALNMQRIGESRWRPLELCCGQTRQLCQPRARNTLAWATSGCETSHPRPSSSSRSSLLWHSSIGLSNGWLMLLQAELKVGDKMSDYADYYRVLNRSDGGAVSISSFQGKKPVVLFFSLCNASATDPKAGTPGCTKEACKFRDEYQRFEEAGAAVFGISSDSPDVNAAFAKEQGLQFPLLTDGNSILRKTFGIKADLLGLLPGRQTYVIDINGKVILSFNDQFNAEQHVSMALNALQNAKAMA